MGRKRKPDSIRGEGFRGKSELSLADYKKLAVEGFGSGHIANLLSDWSGEVVGAVGLCLSNNNRRVTDATFHLLGSLCREKRVSANKYWDLEDTTSMQFSIPDCDMFKFPAGNLVSEIVDGGVIDHTFYVGDQPIEHEDLPETVLGFSIRAFIIPTRESYAKLKLILYPLPKDMLVANHILASNPMFPGVSVFSGEFPLLPVSSSYPLEKNWGCPISPVILPGMDFEESENYPRTALVRAAVAQLMRKAVIPESKAGFSTLLPRWIELAETGLAGLKDNSLDSIWPLPSTSSDIFTEGRDLMFKFTSDYSTTPSFQWNPPPL